MSQSFLGSIFQLTKKKYLFAITIEISIEIFFGLNRDDVLLSFLVPGVIRLDYPRSFTPLCLLWPCDERLVVVIEGPFETLPGRDKFCFEQIEFRSSLLSVFSLKQTLNFLDSDGIQRILHTLKLI